MTTTITFKVDEKTKRHFQDRVGPGKMSETIARFMRFNDLDPFDYAVLAGFLAENRTDFIAYAGKAQMDAGDAEKIMHNVWRCAK